MNKRPHLIREAFACFILLAIGTVAVYGHVTLGIWQGRAPGQFDMRQFFVPMSFLFDFAIHRGEFPLWNPFSFSGTPFAANPQSIVFYPPQLIRSLLTPTLTPVNTYYGLVILFALQSIIAGVGTYLFSRTFRVGPVGSLTAAMAFTFGICLTRRVVAVQFASTLMWIPFLMIGLRRMLSASDGSTRLFYATGCGLLLGVSILSGFVHIHVYIAVLIGSYWIASRVAGLDTPSDVRTRFSVRILARDAAHLALLFFIATFVSAPMLLPAAEYAGYTNRSGADAPKLLEHEQLTLPIRETTLGPLGPDTAYPEGSLGYRTAGISVFVLALAGLLGPKRKEAFALGAVFLALLDCTIGPPFPLATLIDRFSPFQMVIHSRAFVVGSLPLALCAGFGVETMRLSSASRNTKIIRSTFMLIGGIGLIAVSTLEWSDAALHLCAFMILVLVATTWMRLPIPGSAIACGVLFVESLVWNYRAVPILIDKREFIDVTSYTDVPSPTWLENSRVCDPVPNAHLYTLTPVLNGYDPLYMRDVWNLMAPVYYIWNYERILRAQETVIENPRTYHLFKRSFWLVRQYVDGPIPPRNRQFPPTTTAFVRDAPTLPIPEVALDAVIDSPISARVERIPIPIKLDLPDTAFQTERAELTLPDTASNPKHRVLSLQYVARCEGQLQVWMMGGDPKIAIPVLTTQVSRTDETEETLTVPLADLTSAQIDLTFESNYGVCNIEWRKAELLVDQEDENDRIAITARSLNSVTVEVGPLETHRLLVFLDAHYPGWTATVNGEPVEVLRVDDAFKGVIVGPGTHTVEFQVRSSRIRWGMTMSTFALLVVCMSSMRNIYRRRSSHH